MTVEFRQCNDFVIFCVGLLFLAAPFATEPVFGATKIKARNWQTGKLLDSQRVKKTLGTVTRPPLGWDKRQRTNEVYEIGDTFVIESDMHTYTVSEPVRNAKVANVTINAPLKYAIEGMTLFFLDEDGKEHRTQIVKKVLR